MSTEHFDTILQMVKGSNPVLPVREILMIPNNLRISAGGYDPCAFGTPGGAPRLLGPEYPVVVSGPYTYVYVSLDGHPTYVRLEGG
jgi:hypothetical protein